MPIIPISDQDGANNYRDFIFIQAIMRYPHNKVLRDKLLDNLSTKHIDLNDNLHRLSRKGRPKITDKPSNVNGGIISAHILGNMLIAAQHCPMHATRERAMWLLLELPKAEPGAYSYVRSYLFKTWKSFESVAHLWLAWIDSWTLQGRSGIDDPRWKDWIGWSGHENLSLFLAHAEAVRIAAENFRRTKKSKPLLNPKITWKVPAKLELPAYGQMDFLEFTPKELEILNNYSQREFRGHT